METDKLLKLLTLLNGVTSHKWETVTRLVDFINDNNAVIEDKKWADEFYNRHMDIHPLDLSKTSTWSTTEGSCINLYFWTYSNSDGTKLKCYAKIFRYRTSDTTELKFEANISLPLDFISIIEPIILSSFNMYLDNAYHEHLEEQRNIWMKEYQDKILNS